MLCGVGLLLVNQGKILVIRELKGKPELEKKAGMLTFPLETVEPPETPDEAIGRLVREELGHAICIGNLRFLGGFHILEPALTLAFVAQCSNEEGEFQPRDTDVEVVGWRDPRWLLEQELIRKEVPPIIQAFLKR